MTYWCRRRLLRAAMGVLQCYTCRRQAKHRSLAIARLHHRHATCTRALRAVHDHVEAINNAAASLRARQLLRRCFVPWQALAAVTRANRRALEDTMAKADGMLARATQPAAVRVPLWPPAAASLLPVGGRPAREFEHAEPSCAVAQDWIPVTWGREHGDVAPPWGDTSSLQGWPALGKADTAPAQVLVVTHPSCSAEAVAQGRTGVLPSTNSRPGAERRRDALGLSAFAWGCRGIRTVSAFGCNTRCLASPCRPTSRKERRCGGQQLGFAARPTRYKSHGHAHQDALEGVRRMGACESMAETPCVSLCDAAVACIRFGAKEGQ